MALTPYLHAFAIGAVAGSHSLTAPAATLASRRSSLARTVGVLAAGELLADKLPMTPSRLSPPVLGVRAVSGAWSGGAAASARRGSRVLGMAAGLGGALLGSWLGYTLRDNLVKKRGMPALAVALGEDLIALSAGYLLTRTAASE